MSINRLEIEQKNPKWLLRSCGGALPTVCNPTTSAKPKTKCQPVKPSKIVNPRNYTGGIRMRRTMEAQGAFEKPDYVPPRNNTRSSREKEKLANMMAYGQDIEPIPMSRVRQHMEEYLREEPEIDRFQELQEEISERRQFLADMDQLGRGPKYRSIIDTEISQKIREMEVIDKKRTAGLKQLIEEDEKKMSEEIPHAALL